MESSGDKDWATKYLLDPLTAPEPSQEDGPGNTFRPGTKAPTIKQTSPPSRTMSSSGRRLSKTNPYRKSLSGSTNTELKRSASLNSHNPFETYPSPPPSATSPPANYSSRSPHISQVPQSPRSPSHRNEAFGDTTSGRRRRGSSLSERYPGDMSHRPLDTLTKEKAIADRSRHATRKHHIQPDTIDNLDNSGGTAWHHGGPYDATLYARNNSTTSPLAALSNSNAEAIKATPKERIMDSVRGHRPLDGVAAYAPGNFDRNGNAYQYEEGENMMIEGGPEGGAYKRWPGVTYHPDDIKGKGEPSYSIEKALKEHKISDDKVNGHNSPSEGIELKTRPRRSASSAAAVGEVQADEGEGHLGRSGSISKRLSGGLKKRFGSIKRHHHRDE